MKHLLLPLLLVTALCAKAQLGARSITPFVHVYSDKQQQQQQQQQQQEIERRDDTAKGTPVATRKKRTALFQASDLPTFGLYGIGNANTETFSNLNASGKLSGYIRPLKLDFDEKRCTFIDVNFAFNVNASNTDSLIANTLLFPDVGQNSFSASVVWSFVPYQKGKDVYMVSPFFEFANKKIKGRADDSVRSFYTLNSSLGISLQYLFLNDNDKVSFSISPYLAFVHIPEPGSKNYRYLLAGSEDASVKSTIRSWGIKVAFQYNFFQVFADFRTVNGSETDFPVEGFRGFHPNFGTVFNAQIFEK